MSNDTPSPNRVPAGVPTGGQFAASAKGESKVTLGTDQPPLVDVTQALRQAWADQEARGPWVAQAAPVAFVAPGTTVRVLVGHTDSNTYVGRSRALANVWAEHVLGPEDQIQVRPAYDVRNVRPYLVGPDGVRREVSFVPNEKSLFERGPRSAPDLPAEPMQRLDEPRPATSVAEVGRIDLDPTRASRYGHMDYTL